MLTDWRQTVLWQRITSFSGADEDRKKVELCLEAWMPGIQLVLDQGGVLDDFTMHDSQHSFRVAQRMVEIVPPATNLSVYELGLLLLSAYLHDSGMVPRRDVIKTLRLILRVGRDKALTTPDTTDSTEPAETIPAERAAWLASVATNFVAWLKTFDTPIVLPLETAIPGMSIEDSNDYLIAHYCRHRHTDWSAEFIQTQVKVDPYSRWRTDLIELCKSHHWGKDKLNSLGCYRVSTDQMVNIRYLAVILRVADVMDVTPERVPAILYEHRAVSAPSRVYWQKDSTVWLTIDTRGQASDQAGESFSPGIRLEAWPHDGRCHFAVLETAAQIDDELSQARVLAEEDWFADGARSESSRCRWDLPHQVHRRIKPRDEDYIYIDGRFRPDSHKVLKLLSGSNLYQDRLAALRELLQNAFDAVRWCVAEDMLKDLARTGHNGENPADEETLVELRAAMGDRYHVDMDIREEQGRWWLVCRDNGIGMNRAIIERRFLVSGGGSRQCDFDLEERCRAHGFSAEITGQFGIGVLSYFMLGDRFEIRTARRGNPDGCGWYFASDGLENFGELKSLPPHSMPEEHGTELKLRLSPEILGEGGIEAWKDGLLDYLKKKLIHVPCPIRARFADTEVLTLGYGWVRPTEHYKVFVLGPVDKMIADANRQDLRTAEQEARLATRRDWLQTARETILDAMEFQTCEGLLPDGGGRWRAILPVFRLADGNVSLIHPLTPPDGDCSAIRGRGQSITAWKGMAARTAAPVGSRSTSWDLPCVFETDFHSTKAVDLSVNRNDLTLTAPWDELAAPALTGATSMLQEFLAARTASPWSLIDHIAAGINDNKLPLFESSTLWPCQLIGQNHASFSHPVLPLVQTTILLFGPKNELNNGPITTISALNFLSSESNTSSWVFPYQPERLAFRRKHNGGFVEPTATTLWEAQPHKPRSSYSGIAFPPEWANILLIHSLYGALINANHNLVTKITPESWAWISAKKDNARLDLLTLHPHLLEPCNAAAWLLQRLTAQDLNPLQAVTENYKDIATAVWEKAADGMPIRLADCRYYISQIRIIPPPPFIDWNQTEPLPWPADAEWYLDDVAESSDTTPSD
ncbi:MAG: hypothetical protein H7Z12_06440 [Rhodospirillaceae bacterium]|nr:hypothetical protein [Rhodospirillales bacterium]